MVLATTKQVKLKTPNRPLGECSLIGDISEIGASRSVRAYSTTPQDGAAAETKCRHGTESSRVHDISLPNEHTLSPVKAWDGDLQRAHLKGFARLKAIWWRRSLQLYQHFKLAGHGWYRPLMESLKKATAGIDPFVAGRVRRPADVFGETPVVTALALLEVAEAVLGEKPAQLVDLGCGRGLSCLTAASTGISALGLEQEAAWVEAAGRVAAELRLPARFVAGDFLLQEWPSRALFLVVATAYPQELREEILARLLAEAPEAAVLTADWSLPESRFCCRWSSRLPVDWGTAQFALFTPCV